MNLRKRAISGIMLAGSMVVMCAIADAASTVSAEAVAVVADTRTDLATDGTAGVVAQLNQINTDIVEMAAAGIEHSQTILVASADEEAQAVEDTDTLENASVVQNEAASIEESAQIESEEDGTAQDAGTTEDIQETVEENATDIENTENTETENTEETENIENAEDAGNIENTEDAEWQNRLMADVDEFLYVRASDDADAEIIGKLYKGDVADVVESGDTWTHVVSGDVDGYVNNDYCVSGEDALAYAQENVETEAQVNTNGLRVRNEASEDASVITAVSEGTTLTVDTDAEAEDGWVAVKYKGQTAYVSADYVTTELALGEAVTIEEEKAALAKKAEEEAAAKAALEAYIKDRSTSFFSSTKVTVEHVALIGVYYEYRSYDHTGTAHYVYRTKVTEDSKYSTEKNTDYYDVKITGISSAKETDLSEESDMINVDSIYLYEDEKTDAMALEKFKQYKTNLETIKEQAEKTVFKDERKSK